MFIWYRTMSGDASPPTFSISSVMVSSLLVFEQVIVRVRMSFSAKIRAWRILTLIQIFSSSMSQDTRSAGILPTAPCSGRRTPSSVQGAPTASRPQVVRKPAVKFLSQPSSLSS